MLMPRSFAQTVTGPLSGVTKSIKDTDQGKKTIQAKRIIDTIPGTFLGLEHSQRKTT
ncbi:hypothetical protein ACQKPE_15950 [Pseudomonas sp. NPDC089554]|uniref:hypothetical protein n=1 Tax=Pseudomonas sp. NPDC089554 TaxID=3390653 RepID=UPI003D07C878